MAQIPAKAGRRVWLRWVLATLAISVAAASIGISLGEGLGEFRLAQFEISVAGASALVAGVAVTLLLGATYHALLLPGFQTHDARFVRIAYAYALSQLLRYVPGKVVGVLFQVGMLQDKIRPASVVSTLVVHTVHDYAWTFAFCGILLWALLSGSAMPLLAFFPALAVVHIVHRCRASQRVLAAMPYIGRYVPATEPVADGQKPAALTWVLALTWIPMLAGIWMAFTPLFGSEGSLVAGLLCLVAAVVSLAMIVVPSGLVVREAIFLWLGGQVLLPAEKLLFMAVVVRIAMTLAELVAAAVLALVDVADGHRKSGGREH